MYMYFLSSINTNNVKIIQLLGTTQCVGDSIYGSVLLNICAQHSPTADGNGGTILIFADSGGATKGSDVFIYGGSSYSGSTICGGDATIGKGSDVFILKMAKIVP